MAFASLGTATGPASGTILPPRAGALAGGCPGRRTRAAKLPACSLTPLCQAEGRYELTATERKWVTLLEKRLSRNTGRAT